MPAPAVPRRPAFASFFPPSLRGARADGTFDFLPRDDGGSPLTRPLTETRFVARVGDSAAPAWDRGVGNHRPIQAIAYRPDGYLFAMCGAQETANVTGLIAPDGLFEWSQGQGTSYGIQTAEENRGGVSAGYASGRF